MKKIVMSVIFGALVAFSASAYNPPVGGENLFNLASPKSLTGGVTTAGGPIFAAGSDSLLVNPALPAKEQRPSLNAGYTFLFSTESANDTNLGSAIQLGILIPFRYFIFSGLTNCTFADFYEMHLGNSFNPKVGFAKEITDHLSVGLSASGGVAWGNDSDWSLAANVGALYSFGDLGFMKDFRVGASVLNIGKNYEDLKLVGNDPASRISAFPTFLTLKAGAAATMFENDTIKIATALDVTTPFFQNLILDFAAAVSIKDMIYVNVMESINFAEIREDHKAFIPAIGIGYKFTFKVNNKFLEKNDWNQSEFTVSAAYKNMYKTVNAISAGADIYLGMEDTEAPQIEILFDDED